METAKLRGNPVSQNEDQWEPNKDLPLWMRGNLELALSSLEPNVDADRFEPQVAIFCQVGQR